MYVSPGVRLGPYEILAKLGAGGMGDVYRARETRLDRRVAVKILRGAADVDDGLRERFELEGRMIAALNHPNICTLYDIGTQNRVQVPRDGAPGGADARQCARRRRTSGASSIAI